MPDTGAPWNIPYVASTDLVSDWPTDSQDLAEAIADGLDAAGNAGIGSNVVQTVKTDTFSTTSTSFTPVTGLSVTITPSSDTSRILVIVSGSVGISSGASGRPVLKVTGGNAGTFIGDAASSRTRTAMGGVRAVSLSGADHLLSAITMLYVDSPATASAVTYQAEMCNSGAGTVYLNTTGTDSTNSTYVRAASAITAIEVAP